MGTTQADHPWEQPENDELEEDLIVRRKNLNRTQLSSTIDGGFSSNEGGSVGATNGGDQEQDDEEEEEVKDFSQQNGVKVNEDETEKEKQQKSEYLVYYDADKGIWKCRICSWDYQGKTCLTDHNQSLCIFHQTKGTGLHLKSSKEEANGVDSTFDGNIPMKDNIHSQDNGNGMHFITNQNGEHGKDNKLSDSSLQPSEISFEGVQKPEINEEIEVITDVENEFDVETVLKKQETHDLFCPNCNSCITKRVILRKRKRNIPVPGELAKRNKHATSNPNPNPNPSQVNFVSDDSQPLLSNEYDHDKDTDVFRCLSCFSIFMPTGNGFKFFRMFKNKNNQENTQSSQKEVNVKKSWFSNIFASDKVEESNSQGSSRPQANSRTTNDKMVLEKDEVESTQSVGQQQEYPNPIGHGINGKLDVESVTSHVNGNNKAPSYAQVLNSNKPPISEESKNVERGTNGLLTPEANPSPTTIVNIDLEKDQVQLITQQQYPNPLEYKVRERLDSDNLSPSVNGDNDALSSAQESDAIKQTIAQGSDRESNGRSTSDTQLTEDTADHLLTSYHTEFNDKSDYPGMFVVKPPLNNIEAEQEDIISPQHHDGLTLHVPPNIGSLIIDNSQMNQMLDVTIQTNTPGPDLEIGSRAVEQGCDMAATGGRSLDIVKSIVYGGLLETIASLSVLASAVGAGATTLNVLALGLANIFGGLLVISHDLWDLKNEGRGSSEEDRYQQLLGRRMDFPLHMFVSLLSYLVFGFLPPVVYGFSFRESNDMNFKLLMVAAASTVCIMILAAGKAYVQSRRKSYFKTICYYVMFGFAVSGVSYLFGELIMKLLEKIDLFPSGPVVNSGDLGAAALVATY